jgi:hypothetical protein
MRRRLEAVHEALLKLIGNFWSFVSELEMVIGIEATIQWIGDT